MLKNSGGTASQFGNFKMVKNLRETVSRPGSLRMIKSLAVCFAVSGLVSLAFFSETAYAASDDKRVMTIEDYLMDGTAVYDKDLKGLFLNEDDEEALEGGEGQSGKDLGADAHEETAGDGEKAEAGDSGGNGEGSGRGGNSSMETGVPGAKTTDWNLILVNKQKPVPEGYDAELSSLNESMQVDKRIIGAVARLLDAASKDGVELMICSAYRSYDRQTVLFNNKMDKLIKSGMTYFDAYKTASFSVTVPGTSEHQLGLALDIITPGYTDLNSGFADTEAGKWLKENAPDHGFILRYPEGKEHITGIIFEPWHFRYVGKENARYITEHGLVLEEYIELLSAD